MKIYDCFTFFNELDLLEIRLNTLDKFVDKFVLVEATKTHSGESKELFFENNKMKFKKFENKIIHIIMDNMPNIKNGDRWLLENYQRDGIMRGLSNCTDEDIIIISDIDEIPNLDKITVINQKLVSNTNKNDYLYTYYTNIKTYFLNLKIKSNLVLLINKTLSFLNISSNKIIGCKQKLFYYYLNGFIKNNWIGSKIVLYKDLINHYKSSPQQIRNSLPKINISDGGWHFSYLLSPEDISRKIKSFAHSEYDNENYTSIDIIKEKIKKGENLFGRKNENIKYLPIDDNYPKYILDNIEKYKNYINPNYSK